MKILIGIDPDVNKSGYAKFMPELNKLALNTLTFFELFDELKECNRNTTTVYIEAGWLNSKSNFHFNKNQSKSVGERIAKNVGSNHESGRKIVEMCEYLDIKHELIIPNKKKTTLLEFEKITGIKIKNQEKIDAAMLVINKK